MQEVSAIGTPLAPLYVTNEEKQRASRAVAATQSGQDLLGLAVENQWLTEAAGRIYERNKDFEPEIGYKVSQERLSEFDQEFDASSRQYLSEAKSEEELTARTVWLREDIKRHEALSAYGLKGTAVEFTAALFDPVGWAAGLLTGPVGLGAKVGRTANALKTGAVVGAEAAAFETALAMSDTQRGIEDVMMATAGGVILGGSLGAAFRTSAPEIAAAADEIDSALALEVPKSLQTKTVMAWEQEMVTVSDTKVKVNWNKVEQDANAHLSDLEAKAGFTMSAKVHSETSAKIDRLELTKADIDSRWKLERAEEAAKRGASRNAAEETAKQEAYAAIDAKWQSKLAEVDAKIAPMRTSLESASTASNAAAEARAFKAMTSVEKLKKLYGKEVPTLKAEVERQALAWKQVAKQMTIDEKPTTIKEPEGPDDSAGAARVKGSVIDEDTFVTGDTIEPFIESLIRSMDDKPQPVTVNLYGNNWFADKARSVFTTIDQSSNLLFRALGHKLFENPQGNYVPEDTAGILSHLYGNQIRSAVRNRVYEGYNEWASKTGEGLISRSLDLKGTREVFDTLVFNQILKPDPNADASVIKAADGARDAFMKALEIRKNNGEAGFENVTPDPSYVPIVMDGWKMNTAVSRTNKQTVTTVLSLGYQSGKRKIPKKYADKLAELQYTRAMNTTLSARQSFERVISKAEEQDFIDGLVAAGVDPASIKSLTDDIVDREVAASISNRAKSSLGINVNAEFGGVKVLDLINTQIDDLIEGYAKEAAGGAALARHGFKTEQQALAVIDAGEKYGRNLGLNAERLAEEAQMLRDGVAMIMGRSIEVEPNSNLASGLRMARSYTTMIRLQQIGFSTFPELARGISHLGLRTILKAVPNTAIFRRRAARKGGLSSGELNEPLLREQEFLLGYVDEESWVRPVSIRHEDSLPESHRSGVVNFLNKAISVGARVTNVTSGFQAVQGGLGKIVSKSIQLRLVEMANGGLPLERKLMQEVGWTDGFIDDVIKHIKANPKSVNFNGKDFQLLNAESMSPQMREKVGLGLLRMSGRLMQRHFIGDTSMWMNKTLGKTMTQFRSFMLVSAEKQLVHDLRGDKTKAAQILMWSSLLGYLSYTAQMQLQAYGEPNPDQWFADRMADREVAFGVFNKMPQTAIISLGGDALATLGVMPDSWYAAPGKLGFRPQTAGTIAPVLGTVADTAALGRSVADLLSGDAEGREVAERARKLIPVANSVGVGQMLKAGIGEL